MEIAFRIKYIFQFEIDPERRPVQLDRASVGGMQFNAGEFGLCDGKIQQGGGLKNKLN